MRLLILAIVALPLAGVFAAPAAAAPSPEDQPAERVTFRIEAEDLPQAAGDGEDSPAWAAVRFEGASSGSMLTASGNERADSPRLPFVAPRAGLYRVWVRYYRADPVPPGLVVIFRDPQGEGIDFHFCDFSPVMPTDQPYQAPETFAGKATGFIWEPFEMTLTHPGEATIGFAPVVTGASRRREGRTGRSIDCVILTTDRAFDPADLSADEIAAIPAPPAEAPAIEPPDGFVVSAGLPAKASAFMQVDARPFEAGLVNNASFYLDHARALRLGFNHDHAAPSAEMIEKGIKTHGYVESYRREQRGFASEHPSPLGRFVNAQGNVSRSFSFFYEPAQASAKKVLVERINRYLEQPHSDAIDAWRTSVEDGGFMDYSPVAIEAFRNWLKEKHGDIATLNARWGSEHESFEQITPPATFEEGKAAWLEHRDFCGRAYAEAVAWQIPIVQATDPKKRMCIGANSSLDLLAPYFSRFRPMDFDQLLSTAYADQPVVSWDTYCADDQIGCETEMMRSMGDWRRPVVQEWSNHAVDPRLAARSYWTMVSKGVAGIYLFMFQEGRSHATYPKWALQSHDGTPKPKLAAYSDAAQQVHQMEPLLTTGSYTHTIKPIAMYWSRIDLSLDQPHESLYGTGLNSPVHVYATLRSLGYPVRWITPRQVRDGRLSDVSAVVLVGVNHMPDDVAASVESWVKQGGVIIADELPGGWDQYGQPQNTLAPIFGVQLKAPAKRTPEGMLAVQESVQGYGEVTDAAVVRKETFTMVEEMAQQPGATHAVARQVGDFMLSGIGPRRMQCVAGHVVGMTHRGDAGMVVNHYGNGHALYSSIMLGTLHESAGTGYEWDSAQSGLAYRRMLGAFLDFAGLTPYARVESLPENVEAQLRVESPIVTREGNLMLGLVSFNDAPIGAFDLSIKLPEQTDAPPTAAYALLNGSRQIHPLETTIEQRRLRVRMPGFDTHATLLLLTDYKPLVGIELPDVSRQTANLAVATPGQRFEAIATVYNPSSKPLPAGEVTLAIPAGWFQSAQAIKVNAVPAHGSAEVRFTIQPPGHGGKINLRPLIAQYTSGDVRSTPAAEMVWWPESK